MVVRRLIERQDYSFFRCFPYIPGIEYGEKFQDNEDNHSSLGLGTFKWLVSIRLSHLVYRCSDDCYLEPYLLARQFGYDQVYVSNPNPRLDTWEV